MLKKAIMTSLSVLALAALGASIAAAKSVGEPASAAAPAGEVK